MDPIYPKFATHDAVFYDRPQVVAPRGGVFEIPTVPVGWTRHADGSWVYWSPLGHRLPDQGWKIHVSTTPEHAPRTLAAVAAHCIAAGLAFKHLPHRGALFAADGKDADRAGSGKFVTIYPRDEEELERAVRDLDDELSTTPGPYVLSDLRWRQGPVSVRYGAFTRLTVDVGGVPVAAIADPSGALHEDVRSAQFAPPAWATIPAFLRATHAELTASEPPADFPQITRALHHSNGGGVYAAIDTDGARVVLKEGRPHAGLTPDGRDAATRVDDEADALSAMGDAAVTPFRRTLGVHGHRFLVLDHVDGVTLNTAVGLRHPLIKANSTDADLAAYARWADRIEQRIEAALASVHAAGYAHGDLHPGNVLVNEDDRVVLVDLEMARPLVDEAPAVIGAPGFVPPDRRGGAALDRYALGCIRLFLRLPLTPLLSFDTGLAHDLIGAARGQFDLDAAWAQRVRGDLGLLPTAPPTGIRHQWRVDAASALDDVIDAVAAQLRADATPQREDRLWPGDPAQFALPGYSLAHGSLGPIVALEAAGVTVDPELWGWTVRSMRTADTRAGLYDGLAGFVWAARRLGHHADADEALDRLIALEVGELSSDLFAGLAGIGLLLLDEGRADPAALMRAYDVADVLLARDAPPCAASVATGRGGLLRGPSGAALFALRLHDRTGDPRHLHLACTLLDADIAALVPRDDGSVQLDEGWRVLPYLGSGSAGVGLVLAELAERGLATDQDLALSTGIARAASPTFIVESGLFQGRAGLIHTLLRLSSTDHAHAIAAHLDALRWHAVPRPQGLGFPGQALLRLSCDLATGSAGVLSALVALRDAWDGTPDPRGVAVPFLSLPPAPARVASQALVTAGGR